MPHADMSSDPLIRPARRSDLQALCALERSAFVGDRLGRRSFRSLLDRVTVAEGVLAGEPVIAGYTLVLAPRRAASARLYSIAVAPGWRGRGLGERLLLAAEAEVTRLGRQTLVLEVRPDNTVARRLYERAGYQERGWIPTFYEDGAPAIRLSRSLETPPRRTYVVDCRGDLPEVAAAITAASWLASPQRRPGILVNLCTAPEYLSAGYYCSLLAEARGQLVYPSAARLLDLTDPALQRWTVAEAAALWARHGAGRPDRLCICWGRALAPDLLAFADAMFATFQAPLLDVRFSEGALVSLGIPPLSTLAPLERALLLSPRAAPTPLPPPARRSGRRVAILRDPTASIAPSDAVALAAFQRAAEARGRVVTVVDGHDEDVLRDVDALLIRSTTQVREASYRFSRRAEQLGIPVIDSPSAIRCCGNKVFEAEIFRRRGLPHPTTLIVHRKNLRRAGERLGFPLVLKRPDGFSGQGVHRVHHAAELLRVGEALLSRSHLILAQAFIPTDFDWRIGVLQGKPLYACRYFMCDAHWQVARVTTDGRLVEGHHDTVAVEAVPPEICALAVAAAAPFGDGLFGVDLKETPEGPLVIEVNDSPSIEHEVEDQVLGQEIYERVMDALLAGAR